MEVTQENFDAVLPDVLKAISTCEFLAFDCEFSGFGLGGLAILPYDTPALVYDKLKTNISNFTVMQFGLATFSYDAPSKRFRYRAFNFYVFPRLPASLSRLRGVITDQFTLSYQADCLDFLASQKFDFNKWIINGVGFLREAELNKLCTELKRRYTWKMKSGREEATSESTQSTKNQFKVPDHAAAKLVAAKTAIKEFVANDEETEVTLKDFNLQERRLVFQMIEKEHPTSLFAYGLSRDDGTTDIYVKKCTNAEDHDRLQQEKLDAEIKSLEDAAGFCKVIKAITESRKPILGHNMFMDLLHAIQSFCCPLPEDYDRFKAFVQQRFSNLLDTKVVAGQHALKTVAGSGMSLGDLYRKVTRHPFVQIPVESDDQKYGYALSSENLHEAGYDAFLTGFVFIHLANYLGDQKNPKRNTRDVPWDLLRPLIGKITPGRIIDLPYISLATPDLVPSRDHVFHISFTDDKAWTNHDITPLFSPYGPVYINWINEGSAFVSLKSREKSTLVRKAMIEDVAAVNSNPRWRLRTATDFLKEMEQKMNSRLDQERQLRARPPSADAGNDPINENGLLKRLRCS